MSKWEEREKGEFENQENLEDESRLIAKFYDYIDLENSEKERRRAQETNSERTRIFTDGHSIALALLGCLSLMGLTYGFLTLWGLK